MGVIIYELQRTKVYHNSLWPCGLAALASTASRQQQQAAFAVPSRRARQTELEQQEIRDCSPKRGQGSRLLARTAHQVSAVCLPVPLSAKRGHRACHRVVDEQRMSRTSRNKVVLLLGSGPVKCPSTPKQRAPMRTAGGGPQDQQMAGFASLDEPDQPLRSQLSRPFPGRFLAR